MNHHSPGTPTGAPRFHATTVLCVRRDGKTAIGADGQVTLGDTVLKHTARKIRVLAGGKVLAGFAGSVADAFTLFEKFEAKLEQHSGNLTRAAVELGKDWRTDKILRNLEALLVVADKEQTLILSGQGDVIEPEMGCAAIGSGGNYAYSAARALLEFSQLSASEIVAEGLKIAGEICVYTNQNINIEEIK